MIVAITYDKPGLVPGVRVQRLSDDWWLDPVTKEWVEDIPNGILSARAVAGKFASDPAAAVAGPSPYAANYTVDVPIFDPDTYLIFIHGPESQGFALIDPVPQAVSISKA